MATWLVSFLFALGATKAMWITWILYKKGHPPEDDGQDWGGWGR